MKAKLNDQVRWKDGTVTTPNDELNAGRASLSVSEKLHGRTRPAYFVDHQLGGCVEIGQMAYESARQRGF